MTKAPVLLAAAALGLAALSQPGSAGETWPVSGPPAHAAWVVAQGFSDSSGNPWPGPPWAWPFLPPKLGCYEFRQHVRGAWRLVEICQ